MGLEYHNRRRKDGKFVSDWALAMNPPRMDQVHLRAPFELTQAIRKAALEDRQELTTWILNACQERLRARNVADVAATRAR